MPNEFQRAKDKTDLENKEAKGFWKAIALATDVGRSDREIDLSVILDINKCILEEANPDAAGKIRVTGQDVKKLTCIEPPPGSAVYARMLEFEKNMKHKIEKIPTNLPPSKKRKINKKRIDKIFDLAAWIQHTLVAIHPFCEGNGRTSRLMTNVILRRFNLPPSDVKIESDDKEKYINALCQIDQHSNYEPLRLMIIKGSLETLKKEKGRRLNQVN